MSAHQEHAGAPRSSFRPRVLPEEHHANDSITATKNTSGRVGDMATAAEGPDALLDLWRLMLRAVPDAEVEQNGAGAGEKIPCLQ